MLANTLAPLGYLSYPYLIHWRCSKSFTFITLKDTYSFSGDKSLPDPYLFHTLKDENGYILNSLDLLWRKVNQLPNDLVGN